MCASDLGQAPGADGQESLAESSRYEVEPIDFAFLAKQTFDDRDLQREILTLFVAQARRLVPKLERLQPREQADTAHLLKGSARGIGAWRFAERADAFEQADARERVTIAADLVAALTSIEAAIDRRLRYAGV